jgi:hypothetical protein
MTTTINYTVFKIQEINDKISGHTHNNIAYETNEFFFEKPLSEKKYVSHEDIKDIIELETNYVIPAKDDFSNLFEWHLN